MANQQNSNTKTVVVAGVTLIAASAYLLEFLGVWESGARAPILVVYADKLANNLPTVCDGLTKHVTKTPIVVGQKWTKAQCVAETEAAVVRVQQDLARCFRLPPEQQVFDMAASHAWNNGVPSTCGSLAMVAWNEGDWELGCRRMAKSDEGKPVWSYVRTGRKLANGKPEMRFVQGLANRRAAEANNCLAALL